MNTSPVFTHAFTAIGCHHTVLTTDAATLEPAGRLAQQIVAELDLAASRFRADSEVSGIAAQALAGEVTVVVSPLLGGCLAAALHAADITDGLVDPTVGRAVAASGYDADLDVVRQRPPSQADGLARQPRSPVVPGWRTVHYDAATRVLTVPQGSLLDLGATAKAYAADLIARRLAEQLPGGFLVNLGGDIAVSGALPDAGWEIGVEDHLGTTRQVVVSTGQAIATSSTQLRTWTTSTRSGAPTDQRPGTERRHHVLDPRTGRTAATVWAQVSCAGLNAVEANAASTAAIVLGHEAPAWLAEHGIPARLDPADPADLVDTNGAATAPGAIGTATVVRFPGVLTTPGWPTVDRPAA